MSKILPQIIEKTTYKELFDKMVSKGIPVLGINGEVIRDFAKKGINASLAEYWRACSYAIHQQTLYHFIRFLK